MKKREKELRKLKRSELLELMVAQSEEIDALRDEVDRLQKQLDDRTVQLEESGSIAEAAVKISGLLNAAQAAADIYLKSISKAAAKEHLGKDPQTEDPHMDLSR